MLIEPSDDAALLVAHCVAEFDAIGALTVAHVVDRGYPYPEPLRHFRDHQQPLRRARRCRRMPAFVRSLVAHGGPSFGMIALQRVLIPYKPSNHPIAPKSVLATCPLYVRPRPSVPLQPKSVIVRSARIDSRTTAARGQFVYVQPLPRPLGCVSYTAWCVFAVWCHSHWRDVRSVSDGVCVVVTCQAVARSPVCEWMGVVLTPSVLVWVSQ